MHKKIRQKLLETIVPILSKVVEDGIQADLFSCDNIPERVRMLMMISSDIFDEGTFTERDIEVYIDMSEKLLGAKKGTMSFIRDLIQ